MDSSGHSAVSSTIAVPRSSIQMPLIYPFTDVTVYLNYKREPLEQVPADGLQNQQLSGCLVQGEILPIGRGMTWEESGTALKLQNGQADVTLPP